MNADHLKPDKYMKNDKDLTIEELKVRAQPLPSVWAHGMWGIASQRGDHIWGIMHTMGLHSTEGLDLNLGPWHSTRHSTLGTALGAQQHGTPSILSPCVIDCFMTTAS